MKAVFDSINFEESRSPEFVGIKWDGCDLLIEELVEKFTDEISGTEWERESGFLVASLWEAYGMGTVRPNSLVIEECSVIAFPGSADFIAVIKARQENATIWFKIVE
jgi:hypothetical protein